MRAEYDNGRPGYSKPNMIILEMKENVIIQEVYPYFNIDKCKEIINWKKKSINNL